MLLHDKLRVCPKCYGTRIELYLGGYAGRLYHCLDCSYIGFMIFETTHESYESLRKQMEEENNTGSPYQ
jgi:hypothetical protein